MRGEVTIAGVVLLLLSFFGWMLAFVSPVLGGLLCLLSPVFFIIGLILFIVGLVALDAPPAQIVVQQSVPVAPMGGSNCCVCGQPLAYYPQNGRWYCHRCNRYV